MQNQRHLFQLHKDQHYLNCAFKSPLLKTSEEAAMKSLIRSRNPSALIPDDFFRDVQEVRVLFSKLIGCLPSQVAMIPSTSYGFSSALKNIKGEKGQHAICLDKDFPSDYFTLERWCSGNNAELKVLKPDSGVKKPGKHWNDKILDSINEQTAIVLMSSIHWMNGLKFDLEAIGNKCRKVGAKFIVDGTQSVGMQNIDVKKCNIDVLVCASYKWLLGPYSTALAFFGDTFNEGIPLEEAWMNRINARDFSNLADYDPNYTPHAGRYNVGESSNLILTPMLKNSLAQIHKWNPPEMLDYCKTVNQPLLDYLNHHGVEFEDSKYFSDHLFSLPIPETVNSELLKENLTKNKVFLSQRGKGLRVSINVFNTINDIDKLIETLEQSKA